MRHHILRIDGASLTCRVALPDNSEAVGVLIASGCARIRVWNARNWVARQIITLVINAANGKKGGLARVAALAYTRNM